METEELLTVKEFANIAGVSVQSVYKGLNNRLNPWVKLVDNQKMLKSQALQEIYGVEVEQPFKPGLNNQFNPGRDDEIKFLRAQIQQLQDELSREHMHNREKDNQLLNTLSTLAETQAALSAGRAADKQKALAETLLEGQRLSDSEIPVKRRRLFSSIFRINKNKKQ